MADVATLNKIKAALLRRFGENFEIDPELTGLNELEKIAAHCSHRRYLPRPIEPALLRLLCACALSAPSKSDLQQCDIVIVSDAAIQKSIVSGIPDMPWINDAPVFLVFVANGGRLPAISRLRGRPFLSRPQPSTRREPQCGHLGSSLRRCSRIRCTSSPSPRCCNAAITF